MIVIEQDCLSLSSLNDTKIYFKEEESGKIDNDNSIEIKEQLTTLLNLRLKKMHPWPNHIKKEAIKVYYKEFNNIASKQPIQITSSNITLTTYYFASIFDNDSDNDNNTSI
ncbi:3247_t:CDS:2, partial [Racocetra fulgida]